MFSEYFFPRICPYGRWFLRTTYDCLESRIVPAVPVTHPFFFYTDGLYHLGHEDCDAAMIGYHYGLVVGYGELKRDEPNNAQRR